MKAVIMQKKNLGMKQDQFPSQCILRLENMSSNFTDNQDHFIYVRKAKKLHKAIKEAFIQVSEKFSQHI